VIAVEALRQTQTDRDETVGFSMERLALQTSVQRQSSNAHTPSKTSIPGSNPGGASKFQIRRMVVQQQNPLPRSWTTVEYKS
jgi:hypothetical protein